MFDQNQQIQSTPVVPEPVAATPVPTADATTYNTTTVTPEPTMDMASTPMEAPTPTETPEPTTVTAEPTASEPAPAENTETSSTDDSLLSIKKDALQNLTPLLSQLEQTPEEKFRTTMMLVQASDDKSLVQSAYDAAKDIEDEKVRAHALLDIVNEINYFTQEKEDN